MIAPRSGTRVWFAAGVTDMLCGIDSLAARVHAVLREDPYAGHVFAFRGRRGDLLKVLWSDGDGMCLLTKRLERGRFVWPQATTGDASSYAKSIVARRPHQGPTLQRIRRTRKHDFALARSSPYCGYE